MSQPPQSPAGVTQRASTAAPEPPGPLARLAALGVRHPIMQAGMSSASGPRLAGAVSAAGGIGTLGLHDLSVWERVIQDAKTLADGRPLAVNLLLPYTRSRHVDIVIRQGVAIATLFWGDDVRLIRRLQAHGVFVFQQVGSVAEAHRVLEAGIDGLIVQGSEAGGHVRARQPLAALLPEIASRAAGIPVFAAGGIYRRQDVTQALRLGADGVCTGTRFLLTPEADIHDAYRDRLLAADRTLLTTLFGFGWPDLHRVIPNTATARWCGADGRVPAWLNAMNAAFAFTRKCVPMAPGIAGWQAPGRPVFSPAFPGPGLRAGCVEATALYAGEHIARIRDVIPAAAVVADLARGVTDHHAPPG